MSYSLLHTDYSLPLLDRLLSIRGFSGEKEDFLNPQLSRHRIDPFLLNDMDIGTDKIIQAMKDRKSICIFGDYDVDGVTSSFLLYTLLNTYFNYKNVKIMYPDRLADGYGMKVHHVDTIKAAGHDMIITVDNGITSIQEVLHAKNLGLEVIITDHHKALDIIPNADAIINPQVSIDYHFKGICGAGVVLKLTSALLKKSTISEEIKQSIMNHFIPIVAIATVADCVPLTGENRAIVRRGLSQMTRRKYILPSLAGILDFLNISGPLKSYHIGFIIGPRINAGGRLATGYDSLKTLLFTGEKQIGFLNNLDGINDKRKKLQAEALEIAEQQIDTTKKILIAMDPSFHEGIVGIVAGKITEKHYKPSVILHISEKKGLAIGSLRGPDYFDVMEMMQWIQKESIGKGGGQDSGILIKFGGHKQAGGMTLKLKDKDLLIQLLNEYCEQHLTTTNTKKTFTIDTAIHSHERNHTSLEPLQHMEPFGQKNEEPVFILEKTIIKSVEKVGSKGKGHLKIGVNHGGKHVDSLYRSKGDTIDNYTIGQEIDIIGKVKFDDYKKVHFIDGMII